MTSRPRYVAPSATAVAVACVFVLLAAPRAHAAFIESTAAIAIPALRTGFPVNSGGPAFVQPPAFIDLEQDGLYEIIAVDNGGRIHIVNRDAVELGGWPKLINGTPSGPPTVGDIDLDGFPEVACANTDGVLYVFTFNGAYKFAPLVLNSPAVGSPVLAEVDNSGRRAIMIATQDGKLHAITPAGTEAAGWPVTGPGAATGAAFTFTGYDNLPRVGYITSPGGARIFNGAGVLDANYTFNPANVLGPALPVSGPRSSLTINDVDHLYLAGRAGALWRFDPDTISVGRPPVALTAITPDSLFDTPSLVDLNDDLVPEIALRGQNGPLLTVTLRDGYAGDVLFGWPRQFPASAHGGGIVAADLGDGATPEIIFNQGGDKVTCLTALGSTSWTLSGLPSVCAPAVGDLDGDGGLDMAVVTTDGRIMAYTLGLGGVGPKAVEWPNHDGTPDRNRRHHLRDRAELRPQWLPSITPLTVFTTRPMLGDITGDGIPEALWSDYTTSQTFCFTQGSGPVAGYPQTYGKGAVADAPAVGDVTGDGVLETVQSTATGWLVWGNRTGTINSMLIENNRVLGPPALADLNADGVLDVVVGSSSNKLFAVNLVTKTVLPGFPVSTLGAITQSPSLGDITGDGLPDIVVVNNARSISAYPRTGAAVLAGWPKTFVNSVLTQPILVPVAGQTGLAVSFGQARTDSVFAHLVGANGAEKTGWPRRLNGLKIFGPVAGDLNFDNVPDFVFSTDNDSVYVFAANGSTLMQNFYDSPGDLEVAAMVDVDLDQRPDIIVVSDRSEIKAVRFNGLIARSFDRVAFFVESDQPPVFGDLGGDGTLDMGLSDLGTPVLYSFGFGSWNPAFAPWPMKGHDPKRTNAYSGLTVVGVGGPPPGLAPGAEWARAMPNPALGGRIVFSHSRPLEGRYDAAIYDLRGRLVRRIAAGEAQTGAAAPTWTWDGTDQAGSQVRAGVYFYRVTDARGALHTRVVRLQ